MDITDATIVLAMPLDDGMDQSATIRTLAEECCRGQGRESDDAFVMITTEHRDNAVFQRVSFDRAEAAERFRAMLKLVEPRIPFDG